jgi:hypothetical protein
MNPEGVHDPTTSFVNATEGIVHEIMKRASVEASRYNLALQS